MWAHALASALGLAVFQQPAVAAEAELTLAGSGWQLSKVTTLLGTDKVESVLSNATVPGGVWDNLHRAELVGDPLYRENDLVYANVTTQGPDIKGWTFAKTFDCPAAILAAVQAGAPVVLEFGGLQTLANITLNGKHVLSANNMFLMQRVRIPSGLLNPAGNGKNCNVN